MHHPVGFRCKNCGHLVHCHAAGECEVPHACPVCGKGVTLGYDPLKMHELIVAAKTPAQIAAVVKELEAHKSDKTYQPENWEVLAEATEERLAELGLEPHHVERHVPFEKGKGPEREPQVIMRGTSEGLASEDKG